MKNDPFICCLTNVFCFFFSALKQMTLPRLEVKKKSLVILQIIAQRDSFQVTVAAMNVKGTPTSLMPPQCLVQNAYHVKQLKTMLGLAQKLVEHIVQKCVNVCTEVIGSLHMVWLQCEQLFELLRRETSLITSAFVNDICNTLIKSGFIKIILFYELMKQCITLAWHNELLIYHSYDGLAGLDTKHMVHVY